MYGRRIPAHRGAFLEAILERSREWRPRLRLVTADSGGLGKPPARQPPGREDLAERPALLKCRNRKRGPKDRNRHGRAPRGERTFARCAPRLARRGLVAFRPRDRCASRRSAPPLGIKEKETAAP